MPPVSLLWSPNLAEGGFLNTLARPPLCLKCVVHDPPTGHGFRRLEGSIPFTEMVMESTERGWDWTLSACASLSGSGDSQSIDRMGVSPDQKNPLNTCMACCLFYRPRPNELNE